MWTFTFGSELLSKSFLTKVYNCCMYKQVTRQEYKGSSYIIFLSLLPPPPNGREAYSDVEIGTKFSFAIIYVIQ